MNVTKPIDEFIYSISEFSGCFFCKTYNLNLNCPVENYYKDDNSYPSEEKINGGKKICKEFIMKNLKEKLHD